MQISRTEVFSIIYIHVLVYAIHIAWLCSKSISQFVILKSKVSLLLLDD